MKLRKALVASAAALSVSFAGVSVAQAAETTNQTATTDNGTGTPEATNGGQPQEQGSADSFFGSSDENGKVDPNKISMWLGILTTVIGLISSIMSGEGLGVSDITGLLNKII